MTSDEVSELLEELGKLIDRTKVLYEQYFMGIQRIPPAQLHRDIERKIRDLTQHRIRNTALRYRFTNLKQKFGSYNTYWRRTMRQIEQGKYIRDVKRAGRRAASAGKAIPEEILQAMPKRVRERILKEREALESRARREAARVEEATPGVVRDPKPKNVFTIDEDDPLMGGDLDLDAMFAAITDEPKPAAKPPPKPVAKVAPPAPARPKPAANPVPARPPTKAARPGSGPPPGMSEAKGRDLYDRYIKARKLVGDRTDNLSYDKLMRSLNKQAPGIMTKHKAKGVDFNVVIKGDKVVLKAKPIKK